MERAAHGARMEHAWSPAPARMKPPLDAHDAPAPRPPHPPPALSLHAKEAAARRRAPIYIHAHAPVFPTSAHPSPSPSSSPPPPLPLPLPLRSRRLRPQDICSLRSDVDRLAFSVIWEVTPQAEVGACLPSSFISQLLLYMYIYISVMYLVIYSPLNRAGTHGTNWGERSTQVRYSWVLQCTGVYLS